MVSIARKNLFEDLPRFFVAQAGIMLAVSLVTIQTGVLKGFTRSTALLIEQSQADIWIASEEMVHLELTKPLLFEQVSRAKLVKGVAKAEALMLGAGRWITPGGELTPLRVFGFNPEGKLFIPGNITQGSVVNLKQPYTVMVDETNLRSLNVQGIGDVAEMRSLPAQLVGLTENTQSIASSRFVFTSLENANAYINSGFTSRLNCQLQEEKVRCTTIYEKSSNSNNSEQLEFPTPQPLSLTDAITYILVKAKPDQDLDKLKQKLDAALPGTRAYTRSEMAQMTQSYWQDSTGVGFILGLGAAVGFIVGIVIVGQILYTSVSDHLKEFGTLKAMGASNWIIYGVIVEQALWMAVLGYIPGMIICLGLGSWTLATQGIMILITPITATGVFGITILMCVSSALFAIQKVTRVDPAIVFKA